MISPRRIRRLVVAWQNWRSHQAIVRVIPEMADLDKSELEYRKAHKKGSAAINAAKRAAMLAELRREVRRG